MELRILHLSDLHFTQKNDEQDKKFKQLIETLVTQHKEKPFDYIFVTGDIIDKGKTEYFSVALEYFNKLFNRLNFDGQNIFFVPGNHDLDFKIEENTDNITREILKKARFDEIQNKEKENQKILEKIKQRQTAYFSFIKDLGVVEHQLQFCEERKDDVSIIGINSSIFSAKEDHRNQIYFINEQFETIKNKEFKYNKLFILTHHPIDYYEETTKDTILKFAREQGAFIFSGHSHIQAYERQYRDNKAAFQFWCGNFQDNTASFNIVNIDYDIGAFNLSVGKYNSNEWLVEPVITDRIKEFESNILSFLMNIKHLDKTEKFRQLWNELFFEASNPHNLRFEDYWEIYNGTHPTLNQKISTPKLRKLIKNNLSMSEKCLLYILFQKIDRFYAHKLYKDFPIKLSYLDEEKETRYKRDLLNMASYKLPEIFRSP